MASTGEVACIGNGLEEAFYTSWLATDQEVKGKNVFISVPSEQKHKFVEEAAMLQAAGWNIYTTEGTHDYFKLQNITSIKLYKIHEHKEPSVSTAIQNHSFDLMINVPSLVKDGNDGYAIRRLGIDNHIPLLTNAETGRLLLRCLTDPNLKDMQPTYWKKPNQ
jgi:hypothetical protein